MNQNMPETQPPKFATNFLRWFCRPDFLEDVEGDLMEFYEYKAQKSGIRKAKWSYIKEVLFLFRPKMIKRKKNRLSNSDLFKNNIKVAFRHLLKNKGYSAINIGGLALGMTVAILIGLWLWDEISYNTYHKNYDHIALVMQNQTFDDIQTWRGQAKQLAPELRTNYGTHFKYISMSSGSRTRTLNSGDKILNKRGIYMEPDTPHMLTLEMIHGNRDGLQDKLSLLISESTANAFFGDEDPINKMIKIGNGAEVKVTGVYKDIPDNSDFGGIEFFATWAMYEDGLPEWLGWGNSWFRTYVQVVDGADMGEVSESIKMAKWNNDEDGRRLKPELFLHPMSKWHLYSDFAGGVSVGGRIEYVMLFGNIGVFVLVLACINFMNFSTAQSEKRAKEVGIRKAIGSYRSNLISQFLNESLMVAFFAMILSLLLTQLVLPQFNLIADKQVSMMWSSPAFWLALVGFALFTGLLAGSYPAFFLSSFQPAKVLKNTSGKHSSLPRKILVVVQITVSVTLVIGTLIVFQQIQFAKNRPVGFELSNLIGVSIRNDYIQDHYNVFREELLATGMVEEVAKSESLVTRSYVTNSGFDWPGKDPDLHAEFVTMRVTHEFGNAIGWNIIEGRDFSKDIPSDSSAIIINEACVDYLGFEDPIGKVLNWGGDEKIEIIGVVQDMVMQSPYSSIRQMFFFIDYDRTSIANIRLKAGVPLQDAIAEVETVYKKYDAVNPFIYEFADEDHASKFGSVLRVGKLSLIFTILAIVISCLGIFGMASFVAEQRTKEIGIRKVLGASVTNLWGLVSKDFAILVLIACVIAAPISYFLLNNWLHQFYYRMDISFSVFLIAALGTLFITLFTVSYQSIKVALSNPVESLKVE